MGAKFLVGDVFDCLAGLDDGSVDLVMTSPPFLALRSYLPADHPDKSREIGSEADPGAFVDVLCSVVGALGRVLAPHGSVVFELGDTYTGGGNGPDAFYGEATEVVYKPVEGARRRSGSAWPRNKSLALVPELFRITLAYGTNPLTGRLWWEGPDRWLIRNVVRWVRPNPPVGALGDKFRPATTDLVVFTRSGKRFFDLDAVRTPHQHGRDSQSIQVTTTHGGNKESRNDHGEEFYNAGNSAGAPPLDWWKISPKGYQGAHYAVWPAELCVIPIKSMCPSRVCRTCGEPSRRIVGEAEYIGSAKDGARADGVFMRGGKSVAGLTVGSNAGLTRVAPTLGFSDCGHNDWRNGMVLDPFAGTGVTLAVATGHGRDAIGIDLDPSNADLALERVGPLMLEVVTA